jgi:solute carrier family 39 (zinc transporter), member 1/2/3
MLVNKEKEHCCSNTTPFVIMIALSVHSFFEGLALGLCTTFANTMGIFIAILVHKGVAGMSLGISLMKTFPDNGRMIKSLVFCFAVSSPVGIFIGMLIASASDLVQVIFTSLAAGTFVYIGCSEVIVNEFSRPEYRVLKLFMYLLGAGMIMCLFFVERATGA